MYLARNCSRFRLFASPLRSASGLLLSPLLFLAASALPSTLRAEVWNESAAVGEIAEDESGSELNQAQGGLCGNGFINFGEQCDGTNDNACPGLCRQDCQCHARDVWLYWVRAMNTAYRVERRLIGTTQTESLFDMPAELPSEAGLAFDSQAGLLFVSFRSGGSTIWQSELDGSDLHLYYDPSGFTYGVAVDPSSQKAYWTQTIGADHIRRGDYDGGNVQTVLGFSDVKWLAIHPLLERIFANRRVSNQVYEVLRLALDGSEWDTLFSGLTSEPHVFAIDYTRGRLYWGDANGIWRGELDGSSRQQMAFGNVFGIAVDEITETLYFTSSPSTGRIYEANLDGTGSQILISGISDIRQIALLSVCPMEPGDTDCQPNGIPDICESDCDHDGIPNDCEITAGAPDCNENGVPDECDPDCDDNGIIDVCEIADGAPDCQGNLIPDSCDLAGGSLDCQPNGIPDECEPDCDADGIPDDCAIAAGSNDCEPNGIPDECEPDCDSDGITDACALMSGSNDCEPNGIPDECQADCDTDGIPDECAILMGAPDCDGNAVPDSCDLASGASDCQPDGVPDVCQPDCDSDGVPDECEIVGGAADLDGNGIPDECETAPLVGDDSCHTSSGSNLGTPCSWDGDCVATQRCGVKSRYLALRLPGAASVAIQVTLVDVPLNPAREGEVWWAGPQAVLSAQAANLMGAELECTTTPHAQVWTTGVLYLFGGAIVPGSQYEVRACQPNGTGCSVPLVVATGKYGDIVATFGGGAQPNFGDVNSAVQRFQGQSSGPIIPRADQRGPGSNGQPNTPNGIVDFGDVNGAVIAFQGAPYPFGVPACP